MVVAMLAAVGIAAPLAAATPTDASWRDREFAHGTVATLDCLDPEQLLSRATGRLVSGMLAGLSLDPVVALDGVQVVNDGTASFATPASATDLGDDAYSAPIDVALLSSLIEAELGLGLPLDFGTGVYTQYGRASDDGLGTGAAGVVTDAGAVDLDAVADPSTPSLGTLRLGDLPGLGAALGGITDLQLEVGAVAASATADGCADAWYDTPSVERDYAVAGADLDLEVPLVAALGSETTGLATGLGNTLEALTSTTEGLVEAVVEDVVGDVVGGLLTAASLGDIEAHADITLDLAPAMALLAEPLDDGVVQIDLSSGVVSVDLAALVGEVHADSDGLNGRAPNTELLSPEVLAALLGRVDTLLTSFVGDLESALTQVLYDASVQISAVVEVRAVLLILPVHVIDVDIDVSATVGGLLGRSGYPAPSVSAVAALLPGTLLSPLLSGILNTLNSGLVAPLISQLLPALTAPITDGLVTPGLGAIASTIADVVALVQDLVTELGPVLDQLAAVVSVTLNSQPDQPPFPAPPYAGASEGEFWVSALRVRVVDGSAGGASLLDLSLASASSGPNGPGGPVG